MSKQSEIFNRISEAVRNHSLTEPFTVNDVNIECDNFLAKSPSFLSKHCKDNPGNRKVYFERVNKGLYRLYKTG